MKKRWAFLTVLVALALGVAAGWFITRPVQAAMRLSLSCMMLSEAEKAGYLNAEKRSALVAKLASSSSLTASDRGFAPMLADPWCARM
jgi:hypothetical protein